jgi:3-hydroxyacyl-CoA dehydrogenase
MNVFDIKKAVVIGSGVMGSAIAAHMANSGLKVLLLDIVPNKLTEEEEGKGLTLKNSVVRNRIVNMAKERIINTKSMMLYTPSNSELIEYGNLEDDIEHLRDADWIVEVIVEDLKIKESLFAKISPYINEKTLLSSNTSGISINEMSKVIPEELRERFFGSHFFNPVRFMKLIEIIPNEKTREDVVEYMTEFCDKRLGKGVVVAKDNPGFIANRIGAVSFFSVLHRMNKPGFSIEEVDALSGILIGRPRTGTFRLLDMIGIDTIVKLAAYLKAHTNDELEKDILTLPDYFNKMVENGMLGDKSRQGFYKKVKKPERATYTLDLKTFEYESKKSVKMEFLAGLKKVRKFEEKLNQAVYSETLEGQFLWEVVKDTLLFVGKLIPEVSDNVISIDSAMKWGYNWEYGPFELWDMIGVEKSVERMKKEGDEIPAFVAEILESGKKSFYEDVVVTEDKLTPEMLLNSEKAVQSSKVGSLFDIGDGVACYVLHSPNSTINDEVIESIYNALDEVRANYKGMVFASAGKNFCIGANLDFVLKNAKEEKWELLDETVKAFQDVNMAIKYFEKPVVAAPYGMTLGGGAEIVLHSHKVRAHAETYMGLVEIGVGLLPAGGGTKELLLNMTESVGGNKNIDLSPFVQGAFEAITRAVVSGSGPDAKAKGLLESHDAIVINKDNQLFKAKQDVLELAETMPLKNSKKMHRVGGNGLEALLKYVAYQMKEGKFISEYDANIVNKIAHVLTGGGVRDDSLVTEQHLLDLEREAFMNLLRETKTQDRMEQMLMTGKPLRN